MIFTSNDNSSPGLQDLHTIKKENQAFDYQQEPITQENLNGNLHTIFFYFQNNDQWFFYRSK